MPEKLGSVCSATCRRGEGGRSGGPLLRWRQNKLVSLAELIMNFRRFISRSWKRESVRSLPGERERLWEKLQSWNRLELEVYAC